MLNYIQTKRTGTHCVECATNSAQATDFAQAYAIYASKRTAANTLSMSTPVNNYNTHICSVLLPTCAALPLCAPPDSLWISSCCLAISFCCFSQAAHCRASFSRCVDDTHTHTKKKHAHNLSHTRQREMLKTGRSMLLRTLYACVCVCVSVCVCVCAGIDRPCCSHTVCNCQSR